MLHTLGGRFLKRAVPQDANSVPLDEISSLNAMDEMDEPESAGEFSRQTLPEANRRVRTSAAMLGLAISVGAYGLIAPRQGDAAIAAEPTTTDPTSNNANAVPEVPSVAESGMLTSTAPAATTTYTVQEGQTLWKIAELHGVDATKLATLNGLQPNSVLHVGQFLQVPSGDQTVAAIQGVALKSLPNLKAIPAIPSAVVQPMGTLQSQPAVVGDRKAALDNLKQNRDRLKQSLAELKSEESNQVVRVATVPPAMNPTSLVRYQVSPGDTLSSIASTHGISVGELAQLNSLDNPNLVKVNQRIKVPQAIAQVPDNAPEPPAPEATAPVAIQAVQVPTVPSLAATQNATSEKLPLSVGGNAQQMAFSPNRPINRVSPEVQRPLELRSREGEQYVSNLMSEIARLRERYQSRSANAQRSSEATRYALRSTASSPSLFTGARRVNPEFNRRQIAASRSDNSAVRPASTAQTRLERMLADAPKPKTQVIAAAPLRSESYKPILRSPVGKTVAPNLPPLGGSETYLPGAQFKGYVWPAKGVLTSGYGWRWGRMHKGIDIAAPVGTPVVAAAPGRVVTAGWNDGGYGNLVEVEHTDGSVTRYAHNSRNLVRVGQQVRQGQQIAEMGSTGFSTGPHSHFEVHLPGRGAVNPIALLPQSRS
jgi:murein DD-endopeptidase MepM/ murein hydrolase activator NlpD